MFTGTRISLTKFDPTSALWLGLFILCLLVSTHLTLDASLLIRLSSIVVFVFLFFIFHRIRKIKGYKIGAFDLSLFVFVLYVSFSLFWSLNKELAYLEISKMVVVFVLFICLKYWVSTKETHVHKLLGAVSFAFLLSLPFFISQVVEVGGYSYEDLYRISGSSGHKNLYSSFVFLTLICTCLNLDRRSKTSVIFTIIVVLLQLAVIIFLRSRAVWCGVGVLFFMYFFTRMVPLTFSKKKSLLLSASIFTFVAVFFYALMPTLIQYYLQRGIQNGVQSELTDVSTLTERFLVWEKTYELIHDHLLFGAGSGNWKVAVMEYGIPKVYRLQSLNVIFQRPHNEFLKLISEYGLVGILLLAIPAVLFLATILCSISGKANHIQALVISGCLGFGVICFYSFPLERVEHLILLIVLVLSSLSLVNSSPSFMFHEKFKMPFLFLLGITLCSGYVIFQNFKSAYFHRKMLQEKAKGNLNEVVEFCDLSYSPIVSLDDLSLPIHWYRGNANASLQKFDIMLDDFKIAQIKNPFNPNVLNDLGSAYLTHNKLESAILCYEQALLSNPRFDDPKLNLVVTYINLKDWEKAHFYNESLLNDSERREVYRQIIREGLQAK